MGRNVTSHTSSYKALKWQCIITKLRRSFFPQPYKSTSNFQRTKFSIKRTKINQRTNYIKSSWRSKWGFWKIFHFSWKAFITSPSSIWRCLSCFEITHMFFGLFSNITMSAMIWTKPARTIRAIMLVTTNFTNMYFHNFLPFF